MKQQIVTFTLWFLHLPYREGALCVPNTSTLYTVPTGTQSLDKGFWILDKCNCDYCSIDQPNHICILYKLQVRSKKMKDIANFPKLMATQTFSAFLRWRGSFRTRL